MILMRAVALIVFCIFSSPHSVLAQPSRLDAIIASGVLKVGTSGDYRPFTHFNETNKQFEGFDIDLTEDLGKALGVKIDYVQTSWPNLMKDFESGAFDIAIGGISVTLDRSKKGLFSTPYMQEGKTPIARCTNQDRYQTLDDIDKTDVRLIANPGGTNEKFVRTHLKKAQIKIHPNNVTIFEEIIKGNADLMITDASEARFQQKLHPELCAVHPDQPFNFAEKAIWIQNDVMLKAFIDQWLHLLQKTGDYQTIETKWFN